MKGYRNFIIIFSALFILYTVAEINKPKPIDWTITLNRNDKNPYGGFVIYNQLKHIFPKATVQSIRQSVYSYIDDSGETNTASIFMGDVFRPAATSTAKLKKYVSRGNYVITTAGWFYTPFLDSLGAETGQAAPLNLKDSTSINFVNPALKASKNYTFFKGTIDQYFSKVDTAKAIVLSTNNKGKPVYLKIPYGKGAFFIHSAPLCFSNYFLLFKNNASYASKALSYIPADVSQMYWDESEKIGTIGHQTPFRFFLSNEYLRWALRLSLIGMILYVFFEMKRRQRIIPVVEPLKNSTLDFVKTVASVYFNEKDNKAMALQKIAYFLEFIRARFNLSTNEMNDDFIEQLHRKSSVSRDEIIILTNAVTSVHNNNIITDQLLLNLNQNIDNFYKEVR